MIKNEKVWGVIGIVVLSICMIAFVTIATPKDRSPSKSELSPHEIIDGALLCDAWGQSPQYVYDVVIKNGRKDVRVYRVDCR